ncbi:MAG: HlyC/CorC family transporter [Ruminococcaceae bacterium]|jgi:CBS domain containing-hemolysin-like protein|nr:HlyC/CorC family transporter [Oscillospiraceae bacterium]
MDSSGSLIYLLLAVLALAGAYFAAAETAYSSMNTIRIRNYAENGVPRAKQAVRIADRFDKALITMLIGTNITHIAFASLTTMLATRLWGPGSVPAMTVGATVFVFLFVEMLPKSYAGDHSEQLALGFAGSMSFLMKLLTPLSFFFKGVSDLASKFFGADDMPTVTEEELHDIIDTMEEEGGFEPDKSELVQSALDFGETTVQDVFTPRVDMAALDIDSTSEEILDMIRREKYSRIPVYRDTIDDIVGILQTRKYLKAYLENHDVRLAELLTPVHFVHKKTNIHELLDEMSRQKTHLCVITDDYGGTMGIVTVEDILEELVGEIWDEDDVVVNDLTETEPDVYEVSGDMLAEDAFEAMDVPFDEDALEHKTMGAWALEIFEAIPERGDRFERGHLRVTVKELSNNRITLLRVEVLERGEQKTEN